LAKPVLLSPEGLEAQPVIGQQLWTFVRSLLLTDAGVRRWPFDRDHAIIR
jgi:hypothetical protein